MSYNTLDTDLQKELRDASRDIYRDLLMSAKTFTLEEMRIKIRFYNKFIHSTMVGVEDPEYDDVDMLQYADSTEQYIQNIIGCTVSIGLGGVMPIGRHIISEFNRLCRVYDVK